MIAVVFSTYPFVILILISKSATPSRSIFGLASGAPWMGWNFSLGRLFANTSFTTFDLGENARLRASRMIEVAY